VQTEALQVFQYPYLQGLVALLQALSLPVGVQVGGLYEKAGLYPAEVG
jgi:hypothetical protein